MNPRTRKGLTPADRRRAVATCRKLELTLAALSRLLMGQAYLTDLDETIYLQAKIARLRARLEVYPEIESSPASPIKTAIPAISAPTQ